ncbi:histidine--tRNA ligase [Acholeplasma vituli]|uniref:Histidine--tRNA ligase n=1 Tax=Paracholeplasma vituli TaxID=69473 RepID=A0ABT2PV79_9MOLU|nr:histidine--tRNA ligase [Paracholeplasma vituli]MCU0104847.1 histidine--tRNA ligase [Paracholeplasma vituli]
MISKAKGTYDVLPNESHKWHTLEEKARQICVLFGYQEVRTPIFEYKEVFHRQNEQSDMVTKETYNFMDKGDRELTLRPEGTAGVIRSFVENKLYVETPLNKLYYIGPNFRYERPQKGRFRQFSQFGVEAIGSNDPALDAEVIGLAYSFIQKLGLKGVRVRINTLGDNESRAAFKAALKNHFEPHVDTLCEDCKQRIDKNPLRILDCKIDGQHPAVVKAPTTQDYLNDFSKRYFQSVLTYLDVANIDYEIAPKLVRGLDYYTHTVFEIEADIEGFGAQNVLGGGGRYQSLVKELGGPDLPGIGFAFGMERLIIAMESENIAFEQDPRTDIFFIATDANARTQALKLLFESRNQNMVADMDFVSTSFKAQLKSGLKKNAKYLGIIGETELQNKTISLKNTETQQQEEVPLKIAIRSLKDWLGK